MHANLRTFIPVFVVRLSVYMEYKEKLYLKDDVSTRRGTEAIPHERLLKMGGVPAR